MIEFETVVKNKTGLDMSNPVDVHTKKLIITLSYKKLPAPVAAPVSVISWD